MAQAAHPSAQAQAVYDVLVATAYHDDRGRLVSSEPLYRFLMDHFGLTDPHSRRLRTQLVGELTAIGLVRRQNSNGRTVALLDPELHPQDGLGSQDADAGIGYDAYADAAGQDLDAGTTSTRRVEQAFLRGFLLAGRLSAPCAFCSVMLPADLLVAAHVKRRAELSSAERLDFRACAVLACKLGCDALYETGYLAVADDGRLLVSSMPPGPLADRLAVLAGLPCRSHDASRAAHFSEHRLTRFRGGG